MSDSYLPSANQEAGTPGGESVPGSNGVQMLQVLWAYPRPVITIHSTLGIRGKHDKQVPRIY